MSETKVVPELLSVDQVIEQSAEDYKKALALASTTRLQEFNRSVITNKILPSNDATEATQESKELSKLLLQKALGNPPIQSSSDGMSAFIFLSGVVFATVTITLVVIKIKKNSQ